MKKNILIATVCLGALLNSGRNDAQILPDTQVHIDTSETYQIMEGFGASLAFYENWLTAHPNKAAIYDTIFGGLSLDILRLRNAHEYDPGMIDRTTEFYRAAENSLGRPIAILSTSWGPPARLKSNNDRANGGTLIYIVNPEGVQFDYAGFADWWGSSLDEYNQNDIYPDYISIQNEPDFSASWESCRFDPAEKINGTDTIAGYNKALDAVYEMLQKREHKPRLLSPETIGIAYDAVEKYGNAMDLRKIYGIAHHLYHGVDENDPFSTSAMTKVGNYHPEIPHFQTEYSRGDWFALGSLIYKSLHDENVVAYLYWDLIWDGGGLVNLEFPWDKSRWTDINEGYIVTKDYHTFRQFSAFIHPGWKRLHTTVNNNNCKVVAFANPGFDSVNMVIVNASPSESFEIHVGIDGLKIDSSAIFTTSAENNSQYSGPISDSLFSVPAYSINTLEMRVSEYHPDTTNSDTLNASIQTGGGILSHKLYPNPFAESANLCFSLSQGQEINISVFDLRGRTVKQVYSAYFPAGDHELPLSGEELEEGMFIYRIGTKSGRYHGLFIVQKR